MGFDECLSGYENDVCIVDLFGKPYILKIYNEIRTKYDGTQLQKKYSYLKENEIFDSVFFDAINSCGENKCLLYEYIDGDNKFIFLDWELEKIAHILSDIHKEVGIEKELFPYKGSCVERILLESKILIPDMADDICFIHGDFHPGNIIWNNSVQPIVIDWDNCCIGPKEYDVGNMRFDIALYNGVEKAEFFLECYRKYKDVDECRMNKWDNYVITLQEERYIKWSKQNIKKNIITKDELIRNFYRWKSYIKNKEKN